jgi:hypothetical protein
MIGNIELIRPRKRGQFLWFSAISLLWLVVGTIGWSAMSVQSSAEQIDARNAELQKAKAVARPQPTREEAEVQRKWVALQQDRTFPWAGVFRAIERANDPEIELLAFHPDRRQATVVLKGEGKSAESVMHYLETLQAEPSFAEVYLTHTVNVERGRLGTRAFEIHIKLKAVKSQS